MTESEFAAILTLVDNERCRVQFPMRLEHNEADPLAVQLHFPEGNTWLIARDILVDAVAGLWGGGDGDILVKMTPGMEEMLSVCMKSPQGHAHIVMPTAEVREFLDLTDTPDADDKVSAAVDTLIEELLG